SLCQLASCATPRADQLVEEGLVHPQRRAHVLGVGVTAFASLVAQRALLLGDGVLPFLDGPLPLLDGRLHLGGDLGNDVGSLRYGAPRVVDDPELDLLPLRGVLLRVRDQVPESEIAEVTQIPGRLAGPQIAVGRGGRAGRGVPPAVPRRLGGCRGDVAGRGANVASRYVPHWSFTYRGSGRRDVRDRRGAGLTLRGRGGHLGGFLTRAPGGAEHVGLGRLVIP